jgi:hypothetical protein
MESSNPICKGATRLRLTDDEAETGAEGRRKAWETQARTAATTHSKEGRATNMMRGVEGMEKVPVMWNAR